MSLGIDALDHGVQELNHWTKEIADRLGTDERRLAYCALRATMHAVRDRIGPDHTVHLAQQLPLLVRSMFFDGYDPTHSPRRQRWRGAFLEQVHIEGVQPLDIVELERAVKVVLSVLSEHTHHAQIENVAKLFPEDFSDLFPTAKRHGPKRASETLRRAVHVETGIDEIDRSLQEALKWINAVEFRMNTSSSRLAMSALQATLQAMRDQLSIEQAARFGDALPLVLKGAYYEGWHPSSPSAVTTRQEFLDRIGATAFRDQSVSVERAVKAAMEVIAKKISAAAMVEVASTLPYDLTTLWPDEPVPYVDLRATEPMDEIAAPRQPPARGAKSVRRSRGRVSDASGSPRPAPHRSRS